MVLIANMIPEYGTVIRTDNAPQFQRLNSLSNDPNSWLKKFNIKIELGSTFNHNRNPIAENLVKECHKEINKAGYTNDVLNDIQITQVVKNINSRVRQVTAAVCAWSALTTTASLESTLLITIYRDIIFLFADIMLDVPM